MNNGVREVIVEWAPQIVDRPSCLPGSLYARFQMTDNLIASDEAFERVLTAEVDYVKNDIAALFAGTKTYDHLEDQETRVLFEDQDRDFHEGVFNVVKGGFK